MEIINKTFLNPMLINTIKIILPGFLLYISCRCFIWLPDPLRFRNKFLEYFFTALYFMGGIYIAIFIGFLIITGHYFFTTKFFGSLDSFFIEFLIEGYWGWENYYQYDNYMFWIITWLFLTSILIPVLLYYFENRHRKRNFKKEKVNINNVEEWKEKLKKKEKKLKEYEDKLIEKERLLNEDRDELEEIIRKEVRKEEILRIRKETVEEIAAEKEQQINRKNNNTGDNNDLNLFE